MPKKIGAGGKPQEYNPDGTYGTGKAIAKGKEQTRMQKLSKGIEREKQRRTKLGKTQDKHLDKWTEPPTLAEQMAKHLGVDESTATKLVSAVSKWSDGVSKEIRKAQYENNVNSKFYEYSNQLEAYIELAPKWS